MADNILAPLNDFVWTAKVVLRSATTGAEEAVTTGTVTGFLATTNTSSATTAEATWSVSGVYIGGANGFDAGTWMFQLDAAVLTAALLATHFTTATPYFIVTRTNGVRQWYRLRYQENLEGKSA
jgi:hypothetical protein